MESTDLKKGVDLGGLGQGVLGFDCLGGMTQVSRVEVEIKCAGKVLDFF
jgi:hypothetical protein